MSFMGYSNVTTLMYGVILDQVQAKALIGALGKGLYTLDDLGLVPEGDLERVPMGYKDYNWTVYDAGIKSQDSDSRCDGLAYDETLVEHVFGINCGHGDIFKKLGVKQVDVIRNVPERAVRNFNQYCLPVLVKAGIEIGPDIVLVNQVV